MGNVIKLNNNGKFKVIYIMDEDKKVIGITHPDWPFRIMRNKDHKNQIALVCEETDEPFGVLDAEVFNTLLMSWLLIDDPELFDSAKVK